MPSDAQEGFVRRLIEEQEIENAMGAAKPVATMADSDMETLLTERIGNLGGSREVFGIRNDANAIIKKVHLPFAGANFYEFFIWNSVRLTKFRPVFGEVKAISKSGRYLMMEPSGRSVRNG
jgi:hypothetical protein